MKKIGYIQNLKKDAPAEEKSYSQEAFMKDIQRENISQITKRICEIEKSNISEISTLKLLKEAAENNNVDAFNYQIARWQRLSERNFKKKRELCLSRIAEEKREISFNADVTSARESLIEKSGFNPKLIKENDDYYIFILPEMMSRRNQNKRYISNSYMREYVLYLIEKTLIESNTKAKIFKKSTLVFEHHMDIKRKRFYPDADNIDAMVFTDTIQGFFIPGDSLNELNVIHLGIMDSDSYTKVHLVNQEFMPEWLSTHKFLFM